MKLRHFNLFLNQVFHLTINDCTLVYNLKQTKSCWQTTKCKEFIKNLLNVSLFSQLISYKRWEIPKDCREIDEKLNGWHSTTTND